jgi:outer membrane protein OmpA-like peptidoglycan-associated protein
MAPRIVDEREHRRGLILGLTLAEVLLLLLFLLMLALAIPLKTRIETARKTQVDLEALRAQIEILKPIAESVGAGDAARAAELSKQLKVWREIQAILASVDLDQSQLKGLMETMKPFMASGLQRSVLKSLLEESFRIDPDDPPAALKRALAFVRIAGKDVRPEQVSTLTPVVKSAPALKEFDELYKDASRISPTDPPAALRKGLEAIARAGRGGDTDANNGKGTGEHNWPPIISLSEADGYFFATGKAELSPGFERTLQAKIIPMLLELAAKYGVDLIEVTGHTDEQAIAPRNSNLDQALLPVLKGNGQVSALVPSDNAGLGLSRAVAVARVLMADQRVQAYRVLPMSGGQLIDVGERVTEGSKGDLKERRRIEIRLRRSQQGTEPRRAAAQ